MKKTYIIAEISANHGNDLNVTLETLTAIANSGADAVKVQTYQADSLTLDVDNEYFGPKNSGPWKGIKPYDVFKEGALSLEWHHVIKDKANELGLDFFSTPFDIDAVDFLESINVPKYKIASFEINHIPLIKYVASKGKPMIISTGVAEENDIKLAIETCRKAGNNYITLLKCTSQYPSKLEDANLATMLDMKEKFGVKVGLSDHSEGYRVPVIAVSLGAEVVEKHFILDRKIGGPDAFFSMEPHEFKKMVDEIRLVEKALGKVKYSVSVDQKRRRRSIFVSENILVGETFTKNNIRVVRPSIGMQPKFYDDILGKTASCNLVKGSPLYNSDVTIDEN